MLWLKPAFSDLMSVQLPQVLSIDILLQLKDAAIINEDMSCR